MPPETFTGGQYPVLPLRTEVHLPGRVASLEIGRDTSIRAVEAAAKDDNQIVVIPQRNPATRDVNPRDLVEVGVLSEIVQVIKHSPGRFTAVVRFGRRVKVDGIVASEPFLIANVSPLPVSSSVPAGELAQKSRQARDHLAILIADAHSGKEAKEKEAKDKEKEGDEPEKAEKKKESKREPRREETAREALAALAAVTDPDLLVDHAVPYVDLEREELLQLLLETDSNKRLDTVLVPLERRATVLRLKGEIGAELEGETSRTHRESVLRERMRQIQEELGEADDNAEVDELRVRVDQSKMPDEVRAAARKQLARMAGMATASPEFSIARTYVETLCDIPFGTITQDRIDVPAARAILEAEHAGLDKIKKRILEFIAVRKLAPQKQGPILLFVGPPGVGKTSLGRSIAHALERKYVRISLGGVRDEAEIRGHRRTYIGALPGRIVSSLKKAGSMNPVFVLDEIDKMTADMRGDPAAAMLEVLDPEQNKEFTDHYIEVPVDLSKVMFIATANSLDTIPGPLLDRMELIELPGYTSLEKLAIAKRHLLPKQTAEHGIEKDKLEIVDEALSETIHGWTREAGVRNLEREIASLCRAAAVKLASGEAESVHISAAELPEILGPAKFSSDMAGRKPEVGVITGLAWTPVGGDVMFIETRAFQGKGELRLTGQLGDVMKESATAAHSWVRSNAARLGIDGDRIAATDLHVHLPQGAVKKDGPSAGVALTLALVSALSRRPVRNDVAITGEIDLRGHALPVGGIKEKLLAAHRAGIKVVFVPERNAKDLIDIPPEVKNELDIRLMSKIDDALAVALEEAPVTTEPPPSSMPPPVASGGRVPAENLPS
ncbi:MAG: endopeptidase La [Deltaproteobacteria bacterium]|nr:endopeptidase La [Kofleriaceae bacterium]